MDIAQIDTGVFRGRAPASAGDWLTVRQTGVKYMLDLESGAYWMKDGSPLSEALTADSLGIRVFSHPLGAILPPSLDELNLAVEFMISHTPIFIHCKAGVDRTGMVAASYRIKHQGWTHAAAIEEMRSMGMHPWYFYWPQALNKL